MDLFDLQVELAFARRGDVEEVEHVRAEKRLRNAMAGEGVGRDDGVGAGGDQVLLRLLLAGAGDDAQFRVKAARGEHDVHVGGVGGGGRDQPAGALDVGIAQNLLLGGVADERQPSRIAVFGELLGVILDDDEGNRFVRQLAGRAAPDASGPAQDVMFLQAFDLALHTASSEELSELEF